MTDEKKITAVILAGGRSSRMKEDKGLKFIGNKMLVEYVIDALKRVTGEIIIITSNPAYKQFGCSCFEDEMTGKGPLGGIYTGLIHSAAQKCLVTGCDMPFLSKRILSALVKECGDEDVLVTEHNKMAEPLCSVYDKNCIPHFKELLLQGQLKITDAFQKLKTRSVSFDKEEWFAGNEFINLNSEDDLKKYCLGN